MKELSQTQIEELDKARREAGKVDWVTAIAGMFDENVMTAYLKIRSKKYEKKTTKTS